MTMVVVVTAQASPPTCQQTLNACDKALNDQIQLNAAQKDLINDFEMANKIQADIINTKNKELEAWYRQPLVIGGVGIAVGAIAGVYLMSKYK